MKTLLALRIRPAFLATLGLGVALTATSHAAISLTALGGAVTETFTTQPPATSWSTTAGLFGNNGANITNNATADGLVGTPSAPSTSATPVTAALLSAQITAAAVPGTITTANQPRYHSTGTGFVSTTPTGTDGNLVMVTLTNNTGATVSSLSVNYVLGLANSDLLIPEAEFAGHRIYWSLTGLQNSWNPITNADPLSSTNNFNFGFRTAAAGGAANQTQNYTAIAPVASWADGTNAYIVWLDDNAAAGTDGFYTLDNLAFTPVPEPTAGLLALGACGVFGFARRRK